MELFFFCDMKLRVNEKSPNYWSMNKAMKCLTMCKQKAKEKIEQDTLLRRE